MYFKLQKLEDEYGILKDENIQKELNIKKYEEELSNFEKENEELSIQILQEKEKDNNQENEEINFKRWQEDWEDEDIDDQFEAQLKHELEVNKK